MTSSIGSKRYVERLLGLSYSELQLLATTADGLYKPFHEAKRAAASGKYRHVDNPGQKLRWVQTRLLKEVVRHSKIPLPIMGGVPGRSIQDTVREHVGSPCLIILDLRDYFPNILRQDVFRVFTKVLNFVPPIADLLSRIATRKGRLPIGAPTSTHLANLVSVPMVDALNEIVQSVGGRIATWVDDIPISGPVELRTLLPKIFRVIAQYGFAVHAEKTSVVGTNGRQKALGLVLNAKLSVPRSRRMAMRLEVLRAATRGTKPIRIDSWISWLTSNDAQQGGALARLAARKLAGLPLDTSSSRHTHRVPCVPTCPWH